MKVKLVRPIDQGLRAFNHHPDLIKLIGDYLPKRGHSVTRNIFEADCVIFDSEIWDMNDGDPLLPKGTYSPYDKNDLATILDKHLPIVFMDNFDHRGTPDYFCTWPGKNNWEDAKDSQDWGKFMYAAKDVCRVLYFIRKMQLSAPYPDWVYPLEYPLFNEYPFVSKEELYARPNDVCFLGNLSWIRENTLNDLRGDGRLKLDCEFVHCTKRTTLEDWVLRHRQAKMFLEIDASMGSERPQRLIMIAPMLRVKSDHRLAFPREDMVHQVEVGDYKGHISREDIDKILSVVRSPDLLYSIYLNGAEHMKKCYSIEARNDYVIDRMEKLCA